MMGSQLEEEEDDDKEGPHPQPPAATAMGPAEKEA